MDVTFVTVCVPFDAPAERNVSKQIREVTPSINSRTQQFVYTLIV